MTLLKSTLGTGYRQLTFERVVQFGFVIFGSHQTPALVEPDPAPLLVGTYVRLELVTSLLFGPSIFTPTLECTGPSAISVSPNQS